jgi:superfamily II DNA or RNA helicase
MITPRPYQVAGIKKIKSALMSYHRAADFSDAGTGKTIKAALALKDLNRYAIVVCPRAVVSAWELALEQCGVPGEVWTYGLARTEKIPYGRWQVKTKRIKKYIFENVPDDAVLVYDEVQNCKGASTQNSKILIAARQSKIPTLVLSATPAASPAEMKALGYVLGLYPTPSDHYFWALNHGCKKGVMGGLDYYPETGGLERIHHTLAPITDRVRISDIPDFPECDNQVQIIDLPKGKSLDDDYLNLLKELQDEAEEESVAALRIRQQIEHKKLQPIADLAQEDVERGNSVVVFLRYRNSIDTLQEHFGENAVTFHGGLSDKERNRNHELFQSNKKHIILVQIQAGGAGIGFHDLHGERPRRSLLCAVGSANLFYQASGRIPREGAKSKSINRMLIAGNSPEMGLLKVLTENRNALHQLTDADLLPTL